MLTFMFVASESVYFSSRMEILVSKFGRTSKLSPRFLVVVSSLLPNIVSESSIASIAVRQGHAHRGIDYGRRQIEYLLGEENPASYHPRPLSVELPRRLDGMYRRACFESSPSYIVALQAINVTVCEEGDPIIVVPFKTELIQVLMSLTNGAISVNIGPT